MQRRAPLLTIGGINLKTGRTFRKRDKWAKKRASLSRYVPVLEDPPLDIQVAQAWFGTPVAAASADLSASQNVGSFTQSATGQVYVSGQASQNVGAFTQSATGAVWVSGQAAQTVGGFTQSATGEVYVEAAASQTVGEFGTSGTLENDTPAPEPVRRAGGGGVSRGTRRVVVRIDEQEFIVASAAEAQRLIAQAQALAEQTAREKAAELASQERVRMRTARRAAPVIRIEAPDVPEVAAIREQVADVNARIRDMYESALRTALIAREMQRRMEQDEEDALAALLL